MLWLFPTSIATEPTISVNTIIAIKSSDIVNPSCELASDDDSLVLVRLTSFVSLGTFIPLLRPAIGHLRPRTGALHLRPRTWRFASQTAHWCCSTAFLRNESPPVFVRPQKNLATTDL